MRVHDVTDRLVGDELLRFCDVSESTRLGLSGLEHHDVVFELHDHRIVTAGSGGEPVKTVAKLFGSDHQRRWSATAARTTGCAGRRRAATGTAAAGRRCR